MQYLEILSTFQIQNFDPFQVKSLEKTVHTLILKRCTGPEKRLLVSSHLVDLVERLHK